MSATPISADFPFESRFVEVLGSKMHYVEKGEGDMVDIGKTFILSRKTIHI